MKKMKEICLSFLSHIVLHTVTRKFPVNSNGRMERLMCNFLYLGYYSSPNLSIHQNSTQERTWNFVVTLGLPRYVLSTFFLIFEWPLLILTHF